MELQLNGFEILIQVPGDLNLHAIQELEHLLEVQAQRPHKITLDLRKAKRVNTVGLRFLDECLRQGMQVKLLHAPPLLREMLQTLQLETYFSPLLGLEPTTEEQAQPSQQPQ
ncbi:hypothetical protein COW36_11060 [bacterium (Candidatus Blackallbacteria) CG17_big_fil_post_rev_8_21_14_2_50_48_46]|uniref:STAS domain-containing protein n=1 Tax=bacterium (Candidatus Blackallbacteria) CG17_big_fil_post_rev_8_21_14_2_50_48_46 TaxID=2014261 RepID=A0A2M7G5G1_9BACT|nr:MAG: hypothetical protein COW64_18155 [bacterium (Candidatus Blackallbacteria) CG18_big_fil_WC_8_21_14_2_50_49_26]PIW16814.1 MAG: hypothetical protein COW36_11060 [bacterium (Candidatus Blackallbacteria) CG17_big_fil_post_rev_8_21_14_2_50_48_46]PIW48011.1 MAG: hypothetical protein COW20_10775 [bacterium (Candidatus Blackallbacteria) CG13_big_fil_rev_8_21_14_2_50_49_14]